MVKLRRNHINDAMTALSNGSLDYEGHDDEFRTGEIAANIILCGGVEYGIKHLLEDHGFTVKEIEKGMNEIMKNNDVKPPNEFKNWKKYLPTTTKE
jgi:hypothetical protein